MPFVEYNLRLVRKLLRRVNTDPARTGRVLGLSCPDVILTPTEAKRVMGILPATTLSVREDSARIGNFHKAHAITREIVNTPELFKAVGYEFHALDVVASRGGERIHDLNNPLPENDPYLGSFDLVFDIVSNQVFNVAQAMWTAAQCCRVGGFVVHCIQMSMINQGFWSVSPTTYRDFYKNNGFDLELLDAVDGVYKDNGRVKIHPVHRTHVPSDCMNLCVARKLQEHKTPTWPTMTKFLNNPRVYR